MFLILYIYIFSYFLSVFLVYFLGSVLFYFLLQTFSISFFFSSFIPFLIPFCLVFSFFNQNPVNALLLILVSFIFCSFLLFQILSEILTFTFLIVYIGASMMLFLFIIMLFNLQQLSNNYNNFNKWYIYMFLIIFLNLFFNFFSSPFYTIINLNSILFNIHTWFSSIFFFSTITTNGIRVLETLYTIDNIFFIFLTLLLYFTMLGAITLALSTKQ